MERTITLRFVSKEDGLSLMNSGIKRREYGFLAEYRYLIDNMFTEIIFDNKKVEGIEVIKYKVLIAGIREVTFKFTEGFDIIESALNDCIDSALQKIANKNFKAAVLSETKNLSYGFGLRAKVIKYRVVHTSKTEFLRVIQDYFLGVSAKQMQKILEKADKIYAQKVQQAKKLKTINHIRKTKESYKRALAEIREQARKKFSKKSKAA